MMHAETDAPFAAPAPYRGKRNESSYVIEVVKKIAEVKKIPIEEVQNALRSNAERLFGI
jgi:TatD DNase family protein